MIKLNLGEIIIVPGEIQELEIHNGRYCHCELTITATNRPEGGV